MTGTSRTLYASLKPFVIGVGALLILILALGASDGNYVGALVIATFFLFLFLALIPRALVLEERGVRRLTFIPVPLPKRYRLVRWDDVGRFAPKDGQDVHYELRPDRRHFFYLPGQKAGGAFRARYNTAGYFAPPLTADHLAQLLNRELEARAGPPRSTDRPTASQ